MGEKKNTCPMLMNIWLSLMLVALLSKRDRNRVWGRRSVGGVCYINVRRFFDTVLVNGYLTMMSASPRVTIL